MFVSSFMTTKIMPTFQQVENILTTAAVKLHPSEVHGLICGTICSSPKVPSNWDEVLGENLPEKVIEVMKALFEFTAQQLRDFSFDFTLLLPDDHSHLPVRAEALTLWCQGFLTGLHEVYEELKTHEATEVVEALNDLIEIAKMNFEDVVPSEEDESAYVELVEYVRMAVILIYQTMNEAELPVIQSDVVKHLH